MNKAKRSVSQKINKKMHKEIKSAQKPLAQELREYSDTLTPQAILKKYPKKTIKTEKGMLEGFKVRWTAKQSKKQTKRSKRTNCSTVDEKSPPAHIHPEGLRWIKNLRNQNTVQRTRLTKHMAKRK